ncbi:putative transcriptional regulator, TetR family protein [Virgisporangium aliadipatigenens]|uniref:Putative transcriptional regulator, TetR family protein n=1 Tax=Virgisporangium aliadipatigenens TaxID=741659 RepID=A0A8J4DRI0_9ACTN|nr:TetR/AcrR family transcriptional regulator [Virgisporangium aliadipatigenens]GIJ48175.1 putative transcriptional regulator, TetR family protein [Virgisporangium aliadipatigenens]
MHTRNGPGRPRSERCRQDILDAVDDLLVEVGYAAMTMKGIAERAGVGRQTVYRWWSTKAEVLLEACVEDFAEELTVEAHPDPAQDLLGYLCALTTFLIGDPPGIAYRALLGEAQHDAAVRELLRDDPLTSSAAAVLRRTGSPADSLAVAQFVGPVLSQVLVGPAPLDPEALRRHVDLLLTAWRA